MKNDERIKSAVVEYSSAHGRLANAHLYGHGEAEAQGEADRAKASLLALLAELGFTQTSIGRTSLACEITTYIAPRLGTVEISGKSSQVAETARYISRAAQRGSAKHQAAIKAFDREERWY